jgi:hypothetical protein
MMPSRLANRLSRSRVLEDIFHTLLYRHVDRARKAAPATAVKPHHNIAYNPHSCLDEHQPIESLALPLLL